MLLNSRLSSNLNLQAMRSHLNLGIMRRGKTINSHLQFKILAGMYTVRSRVCFFGPSLDSCGDGSVQFELQGRSAPAAMEAPLGKGCRFSVQLTRAEGQQDLLCFSPSRNDRAVTEQGQGSKVGGGCVSQESSRRKKELL